MLGSPKRAINSGSGMLMAAISFQGAMPPMARTTKLYSSAGMKRADKMTFHNLEAGKLASSTSVGVISKPMNFNENTAMAMKIPYPPLGKNPWCRRILSKLQCPLRKNDVETQSEMRIIAKKKMLERR